MNSADCSVLKGVGQKYIVRLFISKISRDHLRSRIFKYYEFSVHNIHFCLRQTSSHRLGTSDIKDFNLIYAIMSIPLLIIILIVSYTLDNPSRWVLSISFFMISYYLTIL